MISYSNDNVLNLFWSLFNTKSALEYEVKQAIMSKISIIMEQVRISVARGVK
jgi:hypothetical protein